MFIRSLDAPAKRIICLVPSITELLAHLSLERETIAITKFCVHPNDWHRNKPRIGGTKNIHINKVIGLRPDLIIANKEENRKEDIELLAQDFPVLLTDVSTVEDALSMIRTIGQLTERAAAAYKLVAEIQEQFNNLSVLKPLRSLYLIWRAPFMSAGGDTFISDTMAKAGFQNVCAHRQRYPEMNVAEIVALDPEIILLASEPYPFTEKHIAELQPLFPSARVVCCDGEMFSWYGSRMALAPAYFDALRSLVD